MREFLFLPGNISAAAMISRLHDNHGRGIICETEADSLSKCLGQDWGNFSDLLRKAFQHEPFSYARMMQNQFIEIPRPKLSVALTGTPNQMKPLMRSVEDGLFSRFIFYLYRTTPKWRDPSEKKGFIYDTYIAGLQDHIKSIYDFALGQEYIFDLTVSQWLKLNKIYEERLRNTVSFVGEETSATVFRLGLIHFRIAMTLSVLRHFETKTDGNSITCQDIDYSISELLTDLYLDHSLLAYKMLTNQLNPDLNGKIDKFFKTLPGIPFKRKDAVNIGSKLGIAERTGTNYLRVLKEYEFLIQEIPQGPYQKVTV